MSAQDPTWEAMIKRRMASAPEYADAVRVVDARRQRKLIEWTIGKRVLEVAEVTDRNGDAVYLTYFGTKLPAGDEEKCVACAWLVEQKRQAVRYVEVIHRRGLFFTADGANLAASVIDGSFEI